MSDTLVQPNRAMRREMASTQRRAGAASLDVPVLISVNEAADLTSLSRTAIFKLRSQGKFPKAVHLGEKRVAFVRSEVAAWVEARIAEREIAGC